MTKGYLCLGVLSVAILSGCGRVVDTQHGFSLRVPSDISVESLKSKAEGALVEVRHRSQPNCLYGRLESFVPLEPRDYFRRLNEETDMARTRPFLEEDARPRAYGRVMLARVNAYDEDKGKYLPAVVGAFSVERTLWIAWIYLRCDDPSYQKKALDLLESVDVR